MVKLNELGFESLSYLSYSTDLAYGYFFLFSDLKKVYAGQKFCADEEEIAKTEAYFEAKD